jgi:hypothetical protein
MLLEHRAVQDFSSAGLSQCRRDVTGAVIQLADGATRLSASRAVQHRQCWHPEGPARPGRWIPRGTLMRGLADSENRRTVLESHACEAPFDWLIEPVMNGLTRLAVEASAATGELRVIGFEPTSRRLTKAVPVTQAFAAKVRDSRDLDALSRARTPTNAPAQ